jgi:oxygen-independent coproporphyrinogen-3 oxidase
MPGIYIHIPFCLQKCSYCDFYSVKSTDATIQRYLLDLKKEILLYQEESEWRELKFQTIYFGGGTPSILESGQIFEIIQLIKKNFQIESNAEITLEVNPETVNPEKLRDFYQIGINRLNLGIQSFDMTELRILNRIHSVSKAIESIESARTAGFTNLGLDFIFGIPGQRLADWRKNLNLAVSFRPEHLSIYGLTIEPRTLLAKKVASGELIPSPEELERQMFLETVHYLRENGYEHYEISNYARPGFRSQHNQIYWREEPYLGFGASAHSFNLPVRYWNVANLNGYHESLMQNQFPRKETEILTSEQQKIEWIFLGLRRREGLDFMAFNQRFNCDFFTEYRTALKQLGINNFTGQKIESEYLVIENEYIKLTETGFLVYNEICAKFV